MGSTERQAAHFSNCSFIVHCSEGLLDEDTSDSETTCTTSSGSSQESSEHPFDRKRAAEGPAEGRLADFCMFACLVCKGWHDAYCTSGTPASQLQLACCCLVPYLFVLASTCLLTAARCVDLPEAKRQKITQDGSYTHSMPGNQAQPEGNEQEHPAGSKAVEVGI